MNVGNSWKILTPRAAESRRHELEQCFAHLRSEDNGCRDSDPAPDRFVLQQAALTPDFALNTTVLTGSISGTPEFGTVVISPQHSRPVGPPTQQWSITYSPDAIVCQTTQGGDGDSYRREEFLSRLPGGDSSVSEWKMTR